ncbi:MAG: glycosyl transferase family protein [Parcubacteria group bacterium Gr01-1014_31]|nr:MAG: glycosyl transferase family protein [Parcubacteria group bacterium Gr01-1014_31]
MKQKLAIVIPALDEGTIIIANSRAVLTAAAASLPDWDTVLVVADNGSADDTAAQVKGLAATDARVRYEAVPQRGKGNAIAAGWRAVDADVYLFMDSDLATDLSALPAVVGAVAHEGYDVAVGSRYAPGAVVARDWLRRTASRGYRWVLASLVPITVQDAPCGFKAISRRVRDTLLPQIRHGGWFFDTELVVRAGVAGYRIKEIPVRWHEPPGRVSKVNIFSLSITYLKDVLRLRRQLRQDPPAAKG